MYELNTSTLSPKCSKMLPALTLLSESEARGIALRWAAKPGCFLELFANTGQMQGQLLDEVRKLYLRDVARGEEHELAQLGMYLAACMWYADARTEKAARRQ